MKILSVFDKKAERFGNPFVSINLGVAVREFAQACQEPKSPMALFPEDIELKFIGDFNELTGEIKPAQAIVTVTAAKEFVTKDEKANG